ncbi:class I SAM-dependent methyltransferase [Solitalea canadensis]|uniref:Methyltransferase family protein n=1 Tax=Solitalea canadensis (strain ATCC 29591 / DSM 3403 / JCM 21819 / LMG 8368 / NBRC 15130 / NCIMB 12057 / USAM 9D) TaxID=929556 RepID=H8KM07_SOLCM|nr:class I SAM-dependent methyltransferase [Solitalea canadensis]AFD08929.1 methyltransferase family protein [Solitalea canadensis DSM 3403]
MEEISRSPINNNELADFITAKDYTVTGKSFTIKIDEATGLLVTTPRPKEEDLGKYYESEEYISHTDGNSSLFEKIYNRVRAYSLKRKLALVESKHAKGSLLDVGCGTGAFLQTCKNAGWNICGVEPGDKAASLAKTKVGDEIYASLFDEALNSQQFDVITMWHVLEHMPDLHKTIERLRSLLKPNGVLVVAVPNYNSYDALHYGEYWAAYDVPRHLYHFSQQSIKELFGSLGIQLMETKPMIFDSFYVSLLSEQYKTGRKKWFSAFLIGLESNIKAQQNGEYSSLIYILKR